MLTILQAETEAHREHARELFGEYLVWANAMMNREVGVSFDIRAILERDMLELDRFSPPAGRLILAFDDEEPAGIACLRKIGADTGAVKRMYVRPASRGKGIGRALLARLCEDARHIGYAKIRLDSAPFMESAHALYHSIGFRDIEPYAESEVPPEFQHRSLFMELTL